MIDYNALYIHVCGSIDQADSVINKYPVSRKYSKTTRDSIPLSKNKPVQTLGRSVVAKPANKT